ncbi:hypothetical protein CXB51_037006 [Gossypium anomalum]|uniref:Uncharacterized protein n=1 Tax=Gossypium anomalum TaxID=47600 RepID=A0A8J5Y2D5_9ROSI|nr:hypothetical protein CXB51_037006 [Gossypium anomalum]
MACTSPKVVLNWSIILMLTGRLLLKTDDPPQVTTFTLAPIQLNGVPRNRLLFLDPPQK